MKHLLLTLIFLSLLIAAEAQPLSTYTFSQYTRTYEPLGASRTEINGGWSEAFINVYSMPIDVKLWGYNRDDADAYVNEKGQLQLLGQYADGLIVSGAGTGLYGSVGFTEAFVNYVVEGAIGSRIAKVEYRRVGFSIELPKTSYISFQIWLYEGTNDIEIHYGPSSIAEGTGAVLSNVGIFLGSLGTTTASITLSGNPASPTLGSGDIMGGGGYLTSAPAENTVYKFSSTGGGTSLEETTQASKAISAYYAAGQKAIFIQSDLSNIQEVNLYSIDGKKVNSLDAINSKTTIIDAAALPAGIYLADIMTAKGRKTQKVAVY